MQFLVNEGVNPTDIYRSLQAKYADEILNRCETSEQCKYSTNSANVTGTQLGVIAPAHVQS